MTAPPASQVRINRAVNSWLRAHRAKKNESRGPLRNRADPRRNPLTGTWTKRDDKSGKFMDVKADAKPFKGARSEKQLRQSAKRFDKTMRRLAKR